MAVRFKVVILSLLFFILLPISLFAQDDTDEDASADDDNINFTNALCTEGGWLTYVGGYYRHEELSGPPKLVEQKYKELKTIDGIAGTKETMDAVWNFFKEERGLTDIQTAAIMGNIAMESEFRMDMIEENPQSDVEHAGIGLFQWTDPEECSETSCRATQMMNTAKERGEDWQDLEFQLWYYGHEIELDGNEWHKKMYGRFLDNSDTLEKAVINYQDYVLRPSQEHAGTACRFMFAKEVFEKYEGTMGASRGNTDGSGPTGNLDYDPFIERNPVQNNTGLDQGDGTAQLSSDFSYYFSQIIMWFVNAVTVVVFILYGLFIVILALLVILMAAHNHYFTGPLPKLILGQKAIEGYSERGIAGMFVPLLIRILIPTFLFTIALTGYINGFQALIMEMLINILP